MKKRMDSLQALRGLAFLDIFLAHCGSRLDNLVPASLGVSIFFVLSGFCMGINYLPKCGSRDVSLRENFKFAVSKVSKLYVLHVLMLLFGMAVRGTPISIKLLWSVLLIQSWFPYSSVFFYGNSVAWFLSTYFFVCFTAPYLLKKISGYDRRGKVWRAMALIWAIMFLFGFIVSLVSSEPFTKWAVNLFPPYRVLDFALGILLGWLYLHRNTEAEKGSRRFYTALEAVVCIACLSKFAYFEQIPISLRPTFAMAPLALAVVYLFALRKGYLTQFLSNRFFVFVGNISPDVYLIHRQVIYFVFMFLSQIGIVGGIVAALIRITVALSVTMLLGIGYRRLDINGKIERLSAAISR